MGWWGRETPGQAHCRAGGRLASHPFQMEHLGAESGSCLVWTTGPPSPSLGRPRKKARLWGMREEEHQEAWGGREKMLGSCSEGAAGALSTLDLIYKSGPRPGQVSRRQVTAAQALVPTPRNLSVTSLLALCQPHFGKPGKEASGGVSFVKGDPSSHDLAI